MRKKSVSFILKRDQFCQFSFLSPVYAALNQRVTFMENTPFKKECSRKVKGGIGFRRKIIDGDC